VAGSVSLSSWTSGAHAAVRVSDHGASARLCDDCGLLQSLPARMADVDCRCPRCDALLRRDWQSTMAVPMALALTSLVFGGVTLSMPFLTIQVLDQAQGFTVRSGASAFLSGGWWLLSFLMIAAVVLVPLLRLTCLLVALGGLAMRRPPAWLYRPLRWRDRLKTWSMLEIIVFGALIAYTHLISLADVQLGPEIFGLGALVVTMIATDVSFEPQTAWDAIEAHGVTAAPIPAAPASIVGAPPVVSCRCCGRVVGARPGQYCARCGTIFRHGKSGSGYRTWVLIAAAAIFYLPATMFPIMTIHTHGGDVSLTIPGCVMAFASSGLWPLAAIIFLTAVVVPLLKMAALAQMVRTHGGSVRVLRRLTKFYRLIEMSGRWSVVNILTVASIAGLIKFGLLSPVTAEAGAAFFGAVVVLITLAVLSFDPRSMWDADNFGDDVSTTQSYRK
jgi:paraquat-inducible protein A